MSTTTSRLADQSRTISAGPLAPRVAGAVLALAVAAIHVMDQGGFPGAKVPTYVGIGYYLLEATAVVVALALLFGGARTAARGWALAIGVALGPIIGFVLSRGPGMPSYTDDRGNWTEPIGVLSLVVEGLLLLLATVLVSRPVRPASA